MITHRYRGYTLIEKPASQSGQGVGIYWGTNLQPAICFEYTIEEAERVIDDWLDAR